jgi:hypothetical protein
LQFNQGYLESYQLSAKPNSPLEIQATIFVTDEVSGSLASISASTHNSNLQVFNYNDSYFSNSDLNILDFGWSFKNTVEPIYYQYDSGKTFINPDKIHIGQKEISADFTTDSQDLILGFTGNLYSNVLYCRHPSLSIVEDYPISGFINKKDFSISVGDFHKTQYSVTQSHINEIPSIGSITTSSYPAQNYITIQSPNLANGYFTSNESFNLVEKVTLGDRDLNFSVNRGASFDTITGIIPNDAINGTLSISTTKGPMIYPTKVNLNFSGIGVSGFWPETGSPHNTILISGSNFFRVTDVLFNGTQTNFNVYDTTGLYHKLIASVPEGATVGKINVVSSLRNVSGLSTGSFYPIPQITGFTPTGTWSGICIIAGSNFSGITNVYFNNIRSPSFTVNNNSRITATIPGTGAGYTKGYIKVSGHRGMEGVSKSIYQPVVRITGMNLISGGIDEDVAISGIFDPDFLYRENGGFRLSFGDEYSIFYRQNNFTLTGLIPTGSFGSARPALYEPDGIGKYPPFTGNFLQIAAPIIEGIVGSDDEFVRLKRFERKDIVLRGKNFNYFFGHPYYAYASGILNADGEFYSFDNIVRNSDGTQLIIKNARVTGQALVGKNHQIFIRNAGGVSTSNFYINIAYYAEELSKVAAANAEPQAGIIRVSPGYAPAIFKDNFSAYAALDAGTDGRANFDSYNLVGPFGPGAGAASGWYELTFNPVINFGAWYFYQKSSATVAAANQIWNTIPEINGLVYNAPGYQIIDCVINNATNYWTLDQDFVLAQTGMLQCFGIDGSILLSTGVNFANSLGVLTNDKIITGVKLVKLFRNDGEKRYLAFSHFGVYD